MAFGLSYAIYVSALNPWMLIPLTSYILFIWIVSYFTIGAITQTKRLEASCKFYFSHLMIYIIVNCANSDLICMKENKFRNIVAVL